MKKINCLEPFLNAGLGIGLLMFLTLLSKRKKDASDIYFLGWIGLSLLQIAFYVVTIFHFNLKGIWAILGFGLPMLSVPLLFLYIQKLTKRTVSLRDVLIHLSSYPLYVFFLILLFRLTSTQIVVSKGFFVLPASSGFWIQLYAIPLAISGLLYCIGDLRLLSKHKRSIAEVFSYNERIQLKWLNYVVYSYLLLFFVGAILIFGSIHIQLMPLEDTFALMGIALSTMLFSFGYYGFQQTPIFSNIDSPQNLTLNKTTDKTQAQYSKSGLNQEKVIEIAGLVSSHMTAMQPYLNEELSLNLLAQSCNLQPTHLSQVINQHFNVNFYDFVNQYRVEEVKNRLLSSDFDELTVLGIALDCGFKSKSSFNRYFKKYTGISPSSYKKQNRD